MPLGRPVLLALAALALAPAAAAAQRVEQVAVNSDIPTRIDHLIGFIPSHGVHPQGKPVVPIRVRLGGRTFRFAYVANSSVVGGEWRHSARSLREAARYGGRQGVFADRVLSARERSFARVAVDLARDADVLAVSPGHPACAGLTRAQAVAIGSRKATRWSQLGLAVTPDAIDLRHTAVDQHIDEPRLGGAFRRPAGATADADGGLSEASAGNPAIAGITSWSRARRRQQSVCLVPLSGVAPTDESVRGLRYPAAYPIAYVVPRHRRAPIEVRAIMQGFTDWLAGPAAADLFERRGMLLLGRPWPAVPGPASAQAPPATAAQSQPQPRSPQPDPADAHPSPTTTP